MKIGGIRNRNSIRDDCEQCNKRVMVESAKVM